jgi:hypothetical protein
MFYYYIMNNKYNIKNDTNVQTYIYFKPESSLFNPTKSKRNKFWLNFEGDNTFKVYPNGNDIDSDDDDDDTTVQNIYENSYKNVKDYIYRLVSNSKFLCKGLNPEYISQTFNNADAIVIVGSSNNILPNGNIFGFALINIDNPGREYKSIYIDVICSHTGIQGAGHILINAIEYIGRKLLMTHIYLRSVPKAYDFYKKYGFLKYGQECTYDGCIMRKYINRKKGGKNTRNTRITRIRTNKTKKRKSTRRKYKT